MRLFSREAPVRSPRDLGRMHPFVHASDALSRTFFELQGHKPPVLTVAQIFAALLPPRAIAPSAPVDGGPPLAPIPHVDMVFASSLAVSELKWADLVDYVTPQLTAYGVGGIVMSAARFESLPPEARAILRRTAEGAGSLLSQRVRAADDLAFAKLRSDKKVVKLTEGERVEWATACRALRDRVRASSAHPDVVDLIVAAGQ